MSVLRKLMRFRRIDLKKTNRKEALSRSSTGNLSFRANLRNPDKIKEAGGIAENLINLPQCSKFR